MDDVVLPWSKFSIVVIILGILAAIVIPQFTNASTSAKNSSVASTLQTVRSQIELFKIQHDDTPPQTTGMAAWGNMVNKSTTTETTVAAPAGTDFGPYLQQAPINPLNGLTGMSTAAARGYRQWLVLHRDDHFVHHPGAQPGRHGQHDLLTSRTANHETNASGGSPEVFRARRAAYAPVGPASVIALGIANSSIFRYNEEIPMFRDFAVAALS